MDRVLELDQKNLTIHVESGVVTQKVAELADAAGLLYPPDPGSMKISTIGGNVAENSGGLRGLKYGVTRDYVMGLEVVLANGETAFFGNKCVKDVAGYSMKDLFIGSEGTLGIITNVLLRLVPKPRAKKTLLAIFSQMDAAARNRLGHYRRQDHPVHAGVFGSDYNKMRRGLCSSGFAPGCRSHPPHGDGWASGGGRGGGAANSRNRAEPWG